MVERSQAALPPLGRPARRVALVRLALTLLFVLAGALVSPPAVAADPPPAAAGPVHVRVGLYMLNVGKYDLGTGTFTVDFYLSLRSDTDMGDQRFEFMNGRGTSDKLVDTPTEKFYRCQVNLMTNVNLQRFPFDEHELPVILGTSRARPRSSCTRRTTR